jgi:hypothetical protein
MQRPGACPEDVRARIAALRVPAEEVSGTRGLPTNWRQGPVAGGGGGGGWQHQGPRGQGPRHGYRHHEGQGPRPYDGNGARPYRPPHPDRAAMPRFGNKANADAKTEDRMMDKIRGKMNKFTEGTYDTTKGWLSELLDSGETGFLTGFLRLVFEMAAGNDTLCAEYARLIIELATAFPHLQTEMGRIYTEFIAIFEEAAEEPAVGSVGYDAYVALRERRKERRGYARFIGEIASGKVLTAADVLTTCNKIVDGIYSVKGDAAQEPLCEEYADCLKALVKACVEVLRPALVPMVSRIQKATDRTGAPGLSNKARYALMDVADLFE